MAALNAQIPVELKKAFAKACTDDDLNLKDAVAEAILRWLEMRAHPGPTREGVKSPDNANQTAETSGDHGFTHPYFRPILTSLQSLLEAEKIKEIQALATLAGALARGIHDDQKGSHEKGEPDSIEKASEAHEATRVVHKAASRSLKDAGARPPASGGDKFDTGGDSGGEP